MYTAHVPADYADQYTRQTVSSHLNMVSRPFTSNFIKIMFFYTSLQFSIRCIGCFLIINIAIAWRDVYGIGAVVVPNVRLLIDDSSLLLIRVHGHHSTLLGLNCGPLDNKGFRLVQLYVFYWYSFLSCWLKCLQSARPFAASSALWPAGWRAPHSHISLRGVDILCQFMDIARYFDCSRVHGKVSTAVPAVR